MRVYHMTEHPYPQGWISPPASLRVTLPNRLCDPAVASDLLNRYLDEWCLADELGLDIMVNEHHSTPTCLTPSCLVTLGILARITKRARLLALGIPIANRTDPVRVAEEVSVVDLISRGRFEMGFIRGVPTEVAPANSNPVQMMDRLWEAHDLILKAMTTHDGPFNWEGRHFQYRAVNIWPRPFQQPHPPVWITTMSLGGVRAIAMRGHVMGTFICGLFAKTMFDEYRKVWSERHNEPAGVDRFGYLALCAVGNDPGEARDRATKVLGYLRTFKQCAEPFEYPPGYITVDGMAKKLRSGPSPVTVKTRSGKQVDISTCSADDLIEAGSLFAGTPDEVYAQITRFCSDVGGIGHLLLMMQGGTLSHAETTDSLKLFGKEVLPRLQAWSKERVRSAA
jgi:alkanesulfonate monooxygenase SsuD/methylene tetrahydromethanopterin reductase-like flavin-dependent oxidoreductase (luciferase family)